MYVTTGSSPSKVLEALRQKGLGEVLSHSLGFVDAFRETVGRPSVARPDTVDASSGFDESRHRHLQAEGKVR